MKQLYYLAKNRNLKKFVTITYNFLNQRHKQENREVSIAENACRELL
jgi:hypothetical protein